MSTDPDALEGSALASASPLQNRREQAFPVLTPAQVARLLPHGRRRAVSSGEVLAEPGDRHRELFVVLSGSVEILYPRVDGEELIVVHQPGQFSGEMSALRGSASMVRARVRAGGEVLAIDEAALRHVVQTDADLSELFMRAFILRRVGLVSSGQGGVILLGSRHSADTLRLRQFLTRNNYPYTSIDVDEDASVQALLERFHIQVQDIPVVLCRGERVLKNPGNAQLADCLGLNPQFEDDRLRDLVVIGAGPGGLAAAVYGASEGLDVLVIETSAPGGQTGTSSRIENYLGFPTGISGQALAGRALVQAQKFGAEVAVAASAVRLRCERRPYEIELSNGHVVRARAVVIASGAEYRKLDIDCERFMGSGVYYAATPLEARLCQYEEAIVVGGGNSAGQAAVYLSSVAKHVHVLVRGPGLADSMSRYLIRRIEESPNITLRTRTRVTAVEGEAWLQRVTWQHDEGSEGGGRSETRDIPHLFLMTGANPNTAWLAGCVALDDKGFVRTGADLHPEDLVAGPWPGGRAPSTFETSRPGVFAVGDIRAGSVKRVAAAVGEGSGCVQAVHRVLQE